MRALNFFPPKEVKFRQNMSKYAAKIMLFLRGTKKMFLTVKKKSLIIAVVAVFAAIILGVTYGEVSKAADAAAARKIPIYSVETQELKVALSFDAAWGADKTEKIMDICDSYGVKATFFLVGFWIDKYPEMTKSIYDRGFLIGKHSGHHLHMSRLNEQEMTKELLLVNDKVKEITGYTPQYFRAPFGEYNNLLVETVANNSMQIIQWDVDSLDWKGISGQELASRVLSKVQAGSIVLMHNNSDHILEGLPIILEGLKEKGLTPVRMDELVYKENYSVDNNGRQIK